MKNNAKECILHKNSTAIKSHRNFNSVVGSSILLWWLRPIGSSVDRALSTTRILIKTHTANQLVKNNASKAMYTVQIRLCFVYLEKKLTC
jgi:hypothetical protein